MSEEDLETMDDESRSSTARSWSPIASPTSSSTWSSTSSTIPDGVSLEVIDGASSSTIEVTVAEDDVAKVIGRRGRTIKAIRTLARAWTAARLDTAVEVEVLG